jgi:hypothetical protein
MKPIREVGVCDASGKKTSVTEVDGVWQEIALFNVRVGVITNECSNLAVVAHLTVNKLKYVPSQRVHFIRNRKHFNRMFK